MGRDPADAVRRFDPGDADAVVDLHERALDAAGTDPADVPGTRAASRPPTSTPAASSSSARPAAPSSRWAASSSTGPWANSSG
jgi:hypothetical protein